MLTWLRPYSISKPGQHRHLGKMVSQVRALPFIPTKLKKLGTQMYLIASILRTIEVAASEFSSVLASRMAAQLLATTMPPTFTCRYGRRPACVKHYGTETSIKLMLRTSTAGSYNRWAR